MLVAMKRGLGHIQGYRSAEKHLMLICISLNNKIYMVLKRQTKMQTSYRSALNTTGSPTTTQCPRSGNHILLFWMQWECISVILHACVYRVLKCDVTKSNIKFVKLWDFSRYSESTTSKMSTCQKLAHLWGKLFLRYYPSYTLMTPSKCLGLNVYTQVKFRRICMESSPYN